MANDGTGLKWGNTTPLNTDLRSNGAVEIRGLRKATDLRVNKEHETLVDMSGDPGSETLSTGGGEHKEGSAKAYWEANGPTKRPDGATNLTNTEDAGRLWVNSSTNVINVRTDAGAWTATTSSVAATARSFITRTVVNSDGGFTNAEGASIFITFQGTHTVNMLVEINITGSSGWTTWLNSSNPSGNGPWELHGGVIIADGAKIRVSPFGALDVGLDFHYMKLG